MVNIWVAYRDSRGIDAETKTPEENLIRSLLAVLWPQGLSGDM